LHGNIIIGEDGSVVYTQHTFDFDGEKLWSKSSNYTNLSF
jgi:hypothetical protein